MTRPKIRRASFGDIPAIYRLIVESHQRSTYSERCQVDEKLAKATLFTSIQRNGMTTVGGTFVAVAEADGEIEGAIVAILQPLYLVLDAIEASDVFWYARPGAHALTAARLLRAMHKWVPEGAFIRQGNTAATGSEIVSGLLLERAGMRRVGGIYEKVKEPV